MRWLSALPNNMQPEGTVCVWCLQGSQQPCGRAHHCALCDKRGRVNVRCQDCTTAYHLGCLTRRLRYEAVSIGLHTPMHLVWLSVSVLSCLCVYQFRHASTCTGVCMYVCACAARTWRRHPCVLVPAPTPHLALPHVYTRHAHVCCVWRALSLQPTKTAHTCKTHPKPLHQPCTVADTCRHAELIPSTRPSVACCLCFFPVICKGRCWSGAECLVLLAVCCARVWVALSHTLSTLDTRTPALPARTRRVRVPRTLLCTGRWRCMSTHL